MDELTTSLLDLHLELDRRGMPVIIGGGFGLYLLRTHLATTGVRTLFDALPEPRATNDLDLFLRADVIADARRAAAVAEAVRSLGYESIPGAEHYQWKRSLVVGDVTREVKLDVLVGPVGRVRPRLHGDRRRVRPRGKSVGIHAHPTEEAVGIEDDPVAIPVTGRLSSGEPHDATILVPRPFPYLLMKLHAFDDRKNDPGKDVGRHHALDAYTIVAMLSEREYERVLQDGRRLANEAAVERARRIVRDSFSSSTALGMLRLREHPLFTPEFAVNEFANVLTDVFANE